MAAVYSRKCANARITIHKWDHHPPHCNVFIGGRKVKVRLDTLEVYQSTVQLPPNVRRCLKRHQQEMQAAWNADVVVIPTPDRTRQNDTA